MNPTEIIRIINFILVIISIIIWSYFHRKFREPAAITPLTWLINVLAFYIYRFYILIKPEVASFELLNLWSSILFTHGILLLTIGAFIASKRLIHNKTYMDRLRKKIEEENK